jgi:hypothetical protein
MVLRCGIASLIKNIVVKKGFVIIIKKNWFQLFVDLRFITIKSMFPELSSSNQL